MPVAAPLRCAAPVGDHCGEGLVWCAPEAAAYWTDINRFLIHRYDEASSGVRSWHFEEPVVALALTAEPGRFLVALGSRLVWWWPATDRRADHGFALPDHPRARLNDGRADPHGHFWIGSMQNNVNPDGSPGAVGKGLGALYRIAPDGGAGAWLSGLGIANTLCWSPDGGTFYFADTLENEIRAFDVDRQTGAISGGRPHFAGFDRGLPDGSAIDAEGHLWNARYGGACLVRIAPDGGVSGVVEVPAPNVTTCAFGGVDLRTLYITSAGLGTPPGHRLAGSLFSLRTEVPGLPENRVRLP